MANRDGWEVRASWQVRMRPFLPFYAVGRKTVGNRVQMISAEGRTAAEAIQRVWDKIERNQ